MGGGRDAAQWGPPRRQAPPRSAEPPGGARMCSGARRYQPDAALPRSARPKPDAVSRVRPAPPSLRSASAALRLPQAPPPLPARRRPHRRPRRLTARYPRPYLPRGAAPTLAARRRRPEPSCASAAAAAHGGLALLRPASRFVPAHYWPRPQLAGAAGGCSPRTRFRGEDLARRRGGGTRPRCAIGWSPRGFPGNAAGRGRAMPVPRGRGLRGGCESGRTGAVSARRGDTAGTISPPRALPKAPPRATEFRSQLGCSRREGGAERPAPRWRRGDAPLRPP